MSSGRAKCAAVVLSGALIGGFGRFERHEAHNLGRGKNHRDRVDKPYGGRVPPEHPGGLVGPGIGGFFNHLVEWSGFKGQGVGHGLLRAGYRCEKGTPLVGKGKGG